MTRLWPEGVPIGVAVAPPTAGPAAADEDALPLRFSWLGQTHQVERITRAWRVHSDWWREPAWRAYYKLTTTSGLLVVIYHELPDGEWFLQRLYD